MESPSGTEGHVPRGSSNECASDTTGSADLNAEKASPIMTIMTALHHIFVECRPILLIYYSTLGIISDICYSRQHRMNRFVNKEMIACMKNFASAMVWSSSAVTCEAGARTVFLDPRVIYNPLLVK